MKTDLSFINYTMTLSRALENINRKISDSQQHEELTEQEVALLDVIHEELYAPGVVTFDRKNINMSMLRVHQVK